MQTQTEHPRTASAATAILAVFRHEWRQLVYAPLTPIFQIGFLVALAVCTFLIADFYATDEAAIGPMLIFLPWVSLILVPALAMRAWIDEPGDRSMELALTLPIPVWTVVVGKFRAGAVVLLITLAFTAPFAATVFYLGEPDPGVMLAGYLAAALLMLSFYAVALFAAVLMREPIGAFVVGVIALFFLLLLGWDVFGRLLRNQIPDALYGTLTAFSPKFWLDRMAKGLVEIAGVVYFVALSAAALLGATLLGRPRKRSRWTGESLARGGLATTAIAVAFGLTVTLAREIPLALDLTAEKEFTLHQGTLSVLERLPKGTEIELYWSESEPSVPASIKSHARRVRDHLRTIAARSEGRVTVRERDPKPDSENELRALGAGLRRIPMTSGDSFFLGASFKHGDRLGRIPYFDIRRDRLVDYDVALALNGLTRTKTPKVGILSPLLQSRHAEETREGLSFVSQLRQAYDLAIIPHFTPKLPDDLDVLILIDATILQRDLIYQIDQFVMGGGSLIVMMDPRLRFHPPSDVVNPEPSEEVNDISDVLSRYGVVYEGENVVGDLRLASFVVDREQRRLSYPYWLRIRRETLSDAHPVTADLNEVFFAEPGALRITAADRAVALVTTTEKAGAHERKDLAGKQPGELAGAFKAAGGKRAIAVALNGPFGSAFDTPPEKSRKQDHRTASTGSPSVFVLADVDWIFDPFSLQRAEVDGRVIVRPLNDNLTFLLNMVEYASGDPALIGIRSRGRLQRPFTRVAELFRTAQAQYRDTESELARRIAKVEGEIAKIPDAAGVERIDQLPENLQAQIRQLRNDLLPVRRALRDIRLKSRDQVDRLGRQLTILNLVAGPLLVLAFTGLIALVRRRA